MSAEFEAGLVLAVFGLMNLVMGAWFVGMMQPVTSGTLPWWSRRFTLAVPAVLPDGNEGWWWLRKKEGRWEWTARQEAAREFRWWEWPKARWMARFDFGWEMSAHWVQWDDGTRSDAETARDGHGGFSNRAMRGASELDRVWARVGLRVGNRRLASAPTGRGPTHDDGRGAA